MGAVRRLAEKLNSSKKMQIGFFVISMTILFLIYLPTMHVIRTTREKENMISQGVVTDFRIQPHISNIEFVDGQIDVSGWLIRQNSKILDIDILFSSEERIDKAIAQTNCFKKDMSGTLHSNAIDYGKNGFTASLKNSELKENICYEIYFVFDYLEAEQENKISKKVFSRNYFFNGVLYNYNPLTYVSPQITDDTLKEIIETENLKYHNAEFGSWVFEQDNRLYLIVDDRFEIKSDGTHRMKFHVHTMQTDLLPSQRQQYGFESKDFFFEEKEIILQEKSGYKIAILDLPSEYEISWIELGLYEVGGTMLKDMSFSLFNGTK